MASPRKMIVPISSYASNLCSYIGIKSIGGNVTGVLRCGGLMNWLAYVGHVKQEIGGGKHKTRCKKLMGSLSENRVTILACKLTKKDPLQLR
ncbi:hypothetical protein TIFTF001_029307 [Ficus carica]|uniref:Uncharacterized protein n=1 Tax=Ficus carica TaxID=3494 RepID=A0AA88IXV0_FICCA|nr:hypothetical protein TIFTF001_029307 [Ficus carica]